jgi:hypothetical protein
MTTTMASDNDDADQALLILFAALTTSSADEASNNTASVIASLQEKLGGPSGVVAFLLQRLWMIPMDNKLDGHDAVTILSYLVESHPLEYMTITALSVRKVVERDFVFTGLIDENKIVSDALLLALAKLLVGPNSEDQVGIATDAHAALLVLCRWDNGHEYHSSIAKRVISTLDMVWNQLQLLVGGKQSSTSIMRIAALMIDICLLGGEEITLALANGILDKLLHIALDHPNDDPLLQFAALDQLERLTVSTNINAARANFLLGHDILRRGLLCMVGSPGDLSNDVINIEDDVWGEMDAINGIAAIRLLSEICRVGVMSSTVVDEGVWNKFQLLLRNFQRALHNFIPHGEVERLAYIHAVSSLVGSCAVVTTASDVTSTILNDVTLLHEWLSLRVSQPKLKSSVLCSLSQVMEPSLWQESSLLSQSSIASRPSDNFALQLCHALSQANYDRDSTELILTSAKSPFIEERLGAYDILKALVMRSVGLRLLLLYDDGTGSGSGYLDWLLNQDLEHTVEGKKAKYQIAESMISCNRDVIGGLLPTKVLRQLEEWIRRGPNFVTTATWEMATE